MGATKEYTLAQVAEHTKDDDVWIVLHGRVYDVTSFRMEHPGGPDILLTYAGEDATDEFEDTFHSKAARKLLQDYFIGNVKGMEQTEYLEGTGSNAKVADGNQNVSYLVPLILLIAALLYKFMQ